MNRKYVFGWAISVLQALSSIALLLTSAWLLSRADQRPSVMYLSIAVVGVRAFALGKAFFRYSERLVLHDATFAKATLVRTNVYESLVSRAPIGLSETSVGSLLTTLVDDTEESLNFDLRYRPALLQSVAVTVAGIAVYFWLVPQYAWVMIVTLLLGAGITFAQSKVTFGKNLAKLNALRTELSELSECLVARARVIRAYEWQERSSRKLDELSLRVAQTEKRIATSAGVLQSFISLTMYLSVAAALWVAFISGNLLPGEQAAVLALLPLAIFEYIQGLPNALQAKQKADVSIQRLGALKDAPISPEIILDGTKRLQKFEMLQIQDAKVRYPNGQTIKLPDLELRAGESISLFADSGAGKTTMANALVGFIRPSDGVISLNKAPIVTFDPSSLREVIGLVEQQPIILAGTIRGNLLMANPKATDEELQVVLQEVGLWAMLEAREGLETEVGSNGSKLSGGEAQRLSLARNLLARRQLIILDEPTSSVEERQGERLVQNFLELAKSKQISIILISHDRKLVKLTDRLVQF